MGRLQERIDGRRAASADAKTFELFTRSFNANIRRSEERDGLDEDRQKEDQDLSGNQIVQRGIVRRQRANNEAASLVARQIQESAGWTGQTPTEIRDLFWDDVGVRNPLFTPDEQYLVRYSTQQWIEGMNRDLETNFLYIEWGMQMLQSENSIEAFAQYSTYIGAKALVVLLTEVPGGLDALRSSWKVPCDLSDEQITTGMKEIRAKYFDDDVETLPAVFIGGMFGSYPWTFDAVSALLTAYSRSVRIARDTVFAMGEGSRILNTPLPDHEDTHLELTKSLDELKLDRAVVEYVSMPSASSIQIAKKYGIPQRKFRTTLRERNVLRPQGRPTKELLVA